MAGSGRRAGIASIVRRFAVTSSPVVPSPAGGAPDETTVAVAQAHGEAVDLELGDIRQVGSRLGRGREAEAAADAGVEGPQLVLAEGVAEAEHRALVADLGERAGLLVAAAPTRWVGESGVRRAGNAASRATSSRSLAS